MSDYEEIDFYLVTNSSGTLEALLDRLDVKKEDAGMMALTYYALYVHGIHRGGRTLVMIDPQGKGGWELDDDKTPDHVRADFVTLNVDKDIIENLTRHARLDDPSDTLARAFILLEKICDVRDSGWGLGLYDATSHTVDKITMKTELEEPAAEATEKVIGTMHPPKPFLH